ncbi:MAG: SDR family NAD(P)-dependent oxidoreductase [Myxococcales bacterium]|nr:SDR family NAD(P)-dependent oxidoreductase [Myxococcales bacterium]
MAEPWVLITGGSAGLGRALAGALVADGWRVIIASRAPERGLGAVGALPALGDRAQAWALDLSDLASVAELTRRVARERIALAAVVANAGVWPQRRVVTRAGLELGFAVGHVGHAALIDGLAPALGDGARVVIVASGLHVHGRIAWDDPSLARGFDPRAAYAQTKLANVMYALALARRQPRWRVNAIHPGVVRTALHGDRPPAQAIAPAVAARGLRALLVDPRHAATTGRYFDQLTPRRPAPLALDRPSQDRLWAMTEALSRAARGRAATR